MIASKLTVTASNMPVFSVPPPLCEDHDATVRQARQAAVVLSVLNVLTSGNAYWPFRELVVFNTEETP